MRKKGEYAVNKAKEQKKGENRKQKTEKFEERRGWS